MKPLFFLLALLPFLFQCNRTTYTSTNFPADYLAFGNGGGFTAKVTTYYILPNGQVFSQKSMNSDTLEHTRISKRTAESLMVRFVNLGLDTLDFNHPGNLYRFVEKHSEDEVIRLTMGDQQTTTPSALKDYYQALSEAVNTIPEKASEQ